ncbi:MAG: MFS transporter [Oscillatoria sp. PMC 1051.18]|nr:MFS transporter [Oscillatoria sp. PMC 1050.18]MEC5030555.1 MFS transporter [Oscillatoria sp. PMC 1051.18]
MHDSPDTKQLPITTRIAYGVGDLGPAMAGNILVVFCFFFLTNVAGLPANLTGLVLLIGNIASAISMLLVGVWSDTSGGLRVGKGWWKKRLWLLGSAPIFGLTFFLLWLIPFEGDWAKFAYYTAVTILFQVAATTHQIPYGALLPDLTEDVEEITRLTGYRFSFSLGGGIGVLAIAQGLNMWLDRPKEEFFILGIICALFIVISIVWCCLGTFERDDLPTTESESLWSQIKPALTNRPLLLLIGIYSFSWLALQLIPSILPYLVTNCLELKSKAIAQLILVMQGTAWAALFVWEPLSRKLGKKPIFGSGAIMWMLAQVGLATLHPGQTNLMYGLAIFAGVGMATAYLIPPSRLPEVVDWDELKTGQRREGLFYSLMMFSQKIVLALGLFFVGQILSWSGFIHSHPGQEAPVQPDSAMLAIRLIIALVPILALLISLVLSQFYPISKEVHEDTVSELEKRRVATQ